MRGTTLSPGVGGQMAPGALQGGHAAAGPSVAAAPARGAMAAAGGEPQQVRLLSLSPLLSRGQPNPSPCPPALEELAVPLAQINPQSCIPCKTIQVLV